MKGANMYNYTKLLNPKSINLVEKQIKLSLKSIDITDILYEYRILFERIKVLKALHMSAKLLLLGNSPKLKFYNEQQKEAARYYLRILNDIEDQIDYMICCEVPYEKVSPFGTCYDAYNIMLTFHFCRDRIVQPARMLYPDLKSYLDEMENLLNEAITKIESRFVMIIPGKITLCDRSLKMLMQWNSLL